MAKQNRKKITKKVGIAGTAIAVTLGMGLTPTIANAVSSDTYFIGFPEWLPIGGSNTLPSDPGTIYDALANAEDKNPLIGWGTGGVNLAPQWVQWYNPNLGGLSLGDINLGDLSTGELGTLLGQLDLGQLTDSSKDQYYTPRQWGQTGTQDVQVDNPEYQAAYAAALAQVMQEDREAILAAEKIDLTISYKVPQPDWWTKGYKILGTTYSLESLVGAWKDQKIGSQSVSAIETTVTIDNPFKDDPEALDAFLETGEYHGTYTVPPIDPAQALGLKRPSGVTGLAYDYIVANWMKPINVPGVDYNFDRTKFGLPGASWEERAEALVGPDIPKQITETQPVMGWIPGGWTTNTFGQWVSPSDQLGVLAGLDFAALSAAVTNGDIDLDTLAGLTGLTPQSLAYFLSGDLGFLAPLLNWTAYIKNVNLIAYGDGAIATGEAYRQYIEAVQNGEIKAGAPLTDGRYIIFNTDENGNPVAQLVNYHEGDGGLFEIITSYPLPNDLEFPNMPVDSNGQPIYPSYTEVPGGVIDLTFLTMTLLRNPGRPNGGLYARFAPIYQELTGVNPVSPERTDVLYGLPPDTVTKLLKGDVSGIQINDLGDLLVILEAADGKPMVITIKTDATWEYDLLSDAPVTANPIAWANSLMSSTLVTTYGSELIGMATGQSGAGVGLVAYQVPDGEYDAGSFYATLTTNQLPLLAPARLIAGLLSVATGEDVNTPLADALEPVLKVLVNTSYTDAVRNEDGSWDRTLDQMHVPTLFGTQTLTRSQAALLAGDIIGELGRGVGSEYTDVVNRVATRVVKFLEDNKIEVPTEIKTAVAKLAKDPGDAIQALSRKVGDEVSKVLGAVDAKLPEGPAALTQGQLADIQKPVGKVLAAANDATGGEVFKGATAALNDPIGAVTKTAKDVETTVTKRVTKTQRSLTHAQERAAKVTEKLKAGDVKGAVKQVGENIKNRAERLNKDINNGIKKVTGKDKSKSSTSSSGSSSGGDSDS